MPRLRAAIVGAGLMGHWHARYASRSAAEIVAIIDADPDAARNLQKRFPRAACCASVEGCLHLPIDVLHICTGSGSHATLTEWALRAGKHVLVEKPAAQTTAQVRRLIEIARERRLQLCPAHQFSFQRGFRRLRRDLSLIGELVRIEYRVHSAGGEGLNNEGRRNVLLELLPHACSLVGRVAPGLSLGNVVVQRFTPDHLDCTAIRGKLMLDLRFSLTARPPVNWFTVAGTSGTLHADLFHGYCCFEAGGTSRSAKLLRPFRESLSQFSRAAVNLAVRTIQRQPAYPGLPELIGKFYRAVAGGTPTIAPEEILESAALIEIVRDWRLADSVHAAA
jgi:predicted dehydrogenase